MLSKQRTRVNQEQQQGKKKEEELKSKGQSGMIDFIGSLPPFTRTWSKHTIDTRARSTTRTSL